MNILLASNNEHKFNEIRGIIRALGASVQLSQPKDYGFSFDCREDGTTFAENAALKARGLFALLRGELLPGVSASMDPKSISKLIGDSFGNLIPMVLADDSGICVRALHDEPGIRSARFGDDLPSPPRNDEERNDLLIERLTGTEDRDAHYVCNAILIVDDESYIQTEAVWHGSILEQRIPGNTGFGYDPIVWLEEYRTSVAAIPQLQKDRVSHRAQAVGRLLRGIGAV